MPWSSYPLAAVAAMPLVFGVGTLLDAIGRRRGALVIFGVTALGVFGCYTLHDPWALTACLALGVFGATGVLPVLASFNAELFPTALRGEAYGWANDGIGRIGHVLSPVLVGLAAERFGWGAAVRATALLPLIAAGIVLARLPETARRELEETSTRDDSRIPLERGRRLPILDSGGDAMRQRSVWAGLATGLALVAAPGSHADDLVQIEIPALAISASSNSFRSLGEDFLLQQGDFSGLVGQAAYTANLRYLEIDDALVVGIASFGSQATLTIPSTGFSTLFTAASPDDLAKQVEDFIRKSGAKEWAKFLEQVSARSRLALLDGNPRAITALAATGAFRRFGLDTSRSRLGYQQEEVARWGAFQLRAETGGGLVDVDRFDDLYTVDGALTLAGHFGRHVGLSLAAMGQYGSYQSADSYDVGLELAIPITILRPDAGPGLFWSVTPLVQSAGGAWIDLAAGGLFIGGGGVNTLALERGPFEISLANELVYYSGLPIDDVQGYDFDTELDQLVTKNGLELGGHLGVLYVDAGATFTNFLTSNAAVDFYATPFVGAGLRLGSFANLRLGYEADLGDGYTAHAGRVKLDFHF